MEPNSPYVHQHYARMLSRSGQNRLALTQIDTAIKNNKNVRILHHTKGKILAGLAVAAESIDMGRKYLLQAEACFKKGIALNNHDNYGFESLAALYFEWSKKISVIDQSEAVDYLSKSEEIISLGLRTVRNRESLWILSAKEQKYLGNAPKSISSLEQAVKEHPGCVIARYVLARFYRQKGQPKDALTVLEPVIKSSSDEFRAFIEYSLALLECGEPYSKAISILQLSTLYGLSDPRFMAIFGGLLYLNGNFTAADDVFARSIKLSFPADELYVTHFLPFDSQNSLKSLRFKGEIVAVKQGYSLIKPEHSFPQIICHASKYKGTLMKKGMRIEFILAFCAKGPLALYPTPV
jgi:tetratricopeptide (TPR) repeat protein